MRNLQAKHRNRKRFLCNPALLRVLWLLGIGIFALVIGVIGALLGSIGLLKQARNHFFDNLDNQWETKCFVFQRLTVPHPCYNCNSTNCTTNICYDEKFKVSYKIFDDSEIISAINVHDTSNPQNIQIGNEYTCYYDRLLNYQSVQWEHIPPKSQAPIIAAGICLIIIAMLILALFAVYVCWVERPRLKQSKRRNQMLRHLSGEH
ncbi:unnamed protein product [Adineta ricciae]|uniref:Uncharacterized protein n=1 Tax=Adineta ricciae TaxID=249248 RepID=A0A815ALD4_ADIRI|nr:unnamed protein product [Adineta ricciae]